MSSGRYLDIYGLQYFWSKVKEYVLNNAGGGPPHVLAKNYSLTAQSLAAASRTLIIGSKISFPVGTLQQGMRLRWTFDVTKTAAGTATSTIDIAVGTTGTTADTARITFTKPAGTAVVDNGLFTIEVDVRDTGASGKLIGHLNMTHNLSTTGLANVPAVNATIESAVFDMTTATNISVCFKSGTSDAYTIKMVRAELFNNI